MAAGNLGTVPIFVRNLGTVPIFVRRKWDCPLPAALLACPAVPVYCGPQHCWTSRAPGGAWSWHPGAKKAAAGIKPAARSDSLISDRKSLLVGLGPRRPVRQRRLGGRFSAASPPSLARRPDRRPARRCDPCAIRRWHCCRRQSRCWPGALLRRLSPADRCWRNCCGRSRYWHSRCSSVSVVAP